MVKIDTTAIPIPDPDEIRDFSIPDGMYKARLVLIEEDISQKGNKMVVATWALTEGEYAGKEFKDFMTLTPKAIFKLEGFLKATGLGELGGVINFEYGEYVNTMAYLKLKKNLYNGTINSQIKVLLPTEDGVGAKMTVTDGLPTGEVPSIGAPAPVEEDSEVPF